MRRPILSLSKGRRGEAFTLAELLVVIGIVGGLVALLLPVMASARQRSQQTQCASNLRQIGLGLEAYSQANGRLPLANGTAGLIVALAEVRMNVPRLFVCPSDDRGMPGYQMDPAWAGLPKSAGDPGQVLASETAARHRGRANVLYFDGHVELSP